MKTDRLTVDGPEVTTVCVGAAPLGSMPAAYGYEVGEDAALATVRRVLESPLGFLDTSNEYGNGESERRIGTVLREAGGLPPGFVIATKADPAPGAGSFSGARVRESFDESADRLGLDRFDVYYLHDPERFPFDHITTPGGALDTMVALRDEGLVGAVGVAGGSIPAMRDYVDTGVLDVVLNHSQYTLLDQSADGLISDVLDAGATFVNAAPYASGMLAKPLDARPNYQYGRPSEEILTRTARLRALCDRFEVPLAAVALQFSTRDTRISSTVVGVSTPERVDELIANEALDIPDGLWDELWDLLDHRPRAFMTSGM